jgi:hypothetical protein
LPSATISCGTPFSYWKRILPGRLSVIVPVSTRPLRSVWLKLAVMLLTDWRCAAPGEIVLRRRGAATIAGRGEGNGQGTDSAKHVIFSEYWAG